MRKLVMLACLLLPIAATAQSDPKVLQFTIAVMPMLEQSSALGLAENCGFVSDNFALAATAQMLKTILADDQQIWAPGGGNVPAEGATEWNRALGQMQSNYDSNPNPSDAECRRFQVNGGVAQLLLEFPDLQPQG